MLLRLTRVLVPLAVFTFAVVFRRCAMRLGRVLMMLSGLVVGILPALIFSRWIA
jgi:tetrahydromethanopterin S-methyltransferase subunit G